MPFRSDLDAAESREKQLEQELDAARRHADELREKQAGKEPATRPAPSASKRARKSPLRRKAWYFAGPVIVAGAFVAMPGLANVTAASCGYRAVVLAPVNECAEAKEALGDDIHFGYVGVACGSTSTGDGLDRASWRVPIAGSRASGVYRFAAHDPGGGWVLGSGVVEVDGKVIDVRQCGSASTAGNGGATSPADLLRSRCEKHDARACRDLAVMYEDGNSVNKDPAAARRYREEACRLGLASACAGGPAEKVEDQP